MDITEYKNNLNYFFVLQTLESAMKDLKIV